MKMNEKFYEAPEVEVVEVAIEQGFAATDTVEGPSGTDEGAWG